MNGVPYAFLFQSPKHHLLEDAQASGHLGHRWFINLFESSQHLPVLELLGLIMSARQTVSWVPRKRSSKHFGEKEKQRIQSLPTAIKRKKVGRGTIRDCKEEYSNTRELTLLFQRRQGRPGLRACGRQIPSVGGSSGSQLLTVSS